jgi:hypothetical protein
MNGDRTYDAFRCPQQAPEIEAMRAIQSGRISSVSTVSPSWAKTSSDATHRAAVASRQHRTIITKSLRFAAACVAANP